ncbi:jg17986 [Pararge aegeria aegeria]|uniref:Jg17986 protein n=1 Tax=Pararge aegeria aegeria TaxID=348720 RepID=A0A8S4S561_9NEOP|nr:jg17986 [Pararge aegeria aegeria]
MTEFNIDHIHWERRKKEINGARALMRDAVSVRKLGLLKKGYEGIPRNTESSNCADGFSCHIYGSKCRSRIGLSQEISLRQWLNRLSRRTGH